MEFKHITWNIWHGRYLDRVIDFLKGERADIVCLQEVGSYGREHRSEEVNMYKRIEGELGFRGEYTRMFRGNEGKGEYDMGVATFSRYKLLDRIVFRYERMPEEVVSATGDSKYDVPRAMLGVKYELDDRELWIFNTHHTITPHATVTERQLENTRLLKDYLSRYENFVLCGDMNTPYGNENYKLLSVGLEDVSLPEVQTLHPTIHKVGKLKYHVDYVFLKGEIISSLEAKVPVVDGSDHLPVVTRLRVGGSGSVF